MSSGVQNFQHTVKQTAIAIQALENKKQSLEPKPRLSNEERRQLKGDNAESEVLGIIVQDLAIGGLLSFMFEDNMNSLLGTAFTETALEVTEEALEESFEEKQLKYDREKAKELEEKRRQLALEEKEQAAANRQKSMLDQAMMLLFMMMIAGFVANMMNRNMQQKAQADFDDNKDFMRRAANDTYPVRQNATMGFALAM